MPGTIYISDEDFVKAWQQAHSIDQVVKAFNTNKSSVQSKAMHFRKNGVPLKKMLRGRVSKRDWEKLIQLAREYSPSKK